MTVKYPFLKMHGLGNDFVILDARNHAVDLNDQKIRQLAHRRTGIGCDQVIVLLPPSQQPADILMVIYNADGSEVSACGNAARCVGWMLSEEKNQSDGIIETRERLLSFQRTDDNRISVDMGKALTGWEDIPLSYPCDTLNLPLNHGGNCQAVGISMGNPHAVFFVPDVDAIDLESVGPRLEIDPLFPERANIEFAQIIDHGHIRMRVWERGAGITMSCGTGACATLVAAVRRGLSHRRAEIILDGGTLIVEWLENGHVLMIGEVCMAFLGIIPDKIWL